ncbi:MAG: thiamine pyrophosphate-dependent enzyme [candidate division Zixibacteria bacterium]|nr:thiamine pyrophosphate-dependent enzyme [candidate division Zixibacteria bacterium]
MDLKTFDMPHDTDIAWCPGCGNYPLLNIMKRALSELSIPPEKLVVVSGIGQAAKAPHYFKGNVFNGLHGRAFSPATAIKVAHPELTVIIETGDGDAYGEGGNHFTHTIRRNPDITAVVHNNMVYGLTKGQASPTSEKGMVTPVQVTGVILEPFNPLSAAIAQDCSFVARAFVGEIPQAVEIIKQAILWEGFALVDVFQPCVVFNKMNTYQWFKEHIYYLDESHDPLNREAAFAKAIETERLPLGVFYKNSKRKIFEKELRESQSPLYQHRLNEAAFAELLASKR